MDPREAQAALEQAALRRQQTIDEGSRPWSGRTTWGICASILALGALADAELIWLWAALMVSGGGLAWNAGVRLRPTPSSRRWQNAMGLTVVVGFLAYVLAQAPARALDWPVPNTVGALAACLVVLALARPVQARLASSRRP